MNHMDSFHKIFWFSFTNFEKILLTLIVIKVFRLGQNFAYATTAELSC